MVEGDLEGLEDGGEEEERGGRRAGEARVQEGDEEDNTPWQVPVPQCLQQKLSGGRAAVLLVGARVVKISDIAPTALRRLTTTNDAPDRAVTRQRKHPLAKKWCQSGRARERRRFLVATDGWQQRHNLHTMNLSCPQQRGHRKTPDQSVSRPHANRSERSWLRRQRQRQVLLMAVGLLLRSALALDMAKENASNCRQEGKTPVTVTNGDNNVLDGLHHLSDEERRHR